MFHPEFTPLTVVPSCINNKLQQFGRTNVWYCILPKSFRTWVFNNHRKEAWLSKIGTLCMEALHKMWIERCAMCHESTNKRIRIEDHGTFMCSTENTFDTHEVLPKELKTHRGKFDSISSKVLRAILCEFNACTQDKSSSPHLTSHTLNTATQFHTDVSEKASELRDVSTKIRH